MREAAGSQPSPATGWAWRLGLPRLGEKDRMQDQGPVPPLQGTRGFESHRDAGRAGAWVSFPNGNRALSLPAQRPPGVADTLHSDSTLNLPPRATLTPRALHGESQRPGAAKTGVGSSHEVTTPWTVSYPESASSGSEDAKSPATSWVHTGREPLQEIGRAGGEQCAGTAA